MDTQGNVWARLADVLVPAWCVSVRKLLVVAAVIGWGGSWSAAEVSPSAREARPLPFLWGAQYYRAPTPEETCWEGDLRTMREQGFNAVKFWVQWRGSHAERGRFDFGDLDRLMALAAKNGLKVTLNTIFDVAPVWLYERYPDAKQVRWDGSIVEPQAVQHRQLGGFPGPCYRHPGALRERQRFMRALLEHFRESPALDMVDVWNEPEQNGLDRAPTLSRTTCYCPHCRAAFLVWLKGKYRTLEHLNRVWGRVYGAWEQVETPRDARAGYTDFIDWREFHLDGMTAEAEWRLRMVRELAPRATSYLHVVPNTMRIFNAVTCVDDFALARECDVFAGTTFAGAIFSTELLSAAQGRITYNVECHINGGQTSLHQKVIRLQDIRREFLPQLGLGIRGFLFWQYRPEVLGGESPAWCLVRPDGTPRPATVAAREFWSGLQPHAGRLMSCSGPVPRVAIWKSRRNELFHFASDGDFAKLADAVEAYTEALYWNSVPCKYVDSKLLENGGLDGIRLLIMPSGYCLSEPEARALDRWVRGGGVLLSEAHLGGYNDTTGRHSGPVPGCGLAESWGLRETESTASVHLAQSLGKEAFAADMNPDVRKAFEHFGVTGGKFYPIVLSKGVALAGCDRFAALGGEELQVEGTYADGVPVIVSKQVGTGRVIYCGTNPGQGRARLPEGFRELVRRALCAAEIKPVLGCRTDEPETVRVDVIGDDELRPAFITVFNRTARQQALALSGTGRYRGVYSGMELMLENAGTLRLPPDFAELFVREETAPR
jgi:beta-galactosidase